MPSARPKRRAGSGDEIDQAWKERDRSVMWTGNFQLQLLQFLFIFPVAIRTAPVRRLVFAVRRFYRISL